MTHFLGTLIHSMLPPFLLVTYIIITVRLKAGQTIDFWFKKFCAI
jgi:hypothetical protein